MTALDYMKKQAASCQRNLEVARSRSTTPAQDLQNLIAKIGYYEEAVSALEYLQWEDYSAQTRRHRPRLRGVYYEY